MTKIPGIDLARPIKIVISTTKEILEHDIPANTKLTIKAPGLTAPEQATPSSAVTPVELGSVAAQDFSNATIGKPLGYAGTLDVTNGVANLTTDPLGDNTVTTMVFQARTGTFIRLSQTLPIFLKNLSAQNLRAIQLGFQDANGNVASGPDIVIDVRNLIVNQDIAIADILAILAQKGIDPNQIISISLGAKGKQPIL